MFLLRYDSLIDLVNWSSNTLVALYVVAFGNGMIETMELRFINPNLSCSGLVDLSNY